MEFGPALASTASNMAAHITRLLSGDIAATATKSTGESPATDPAVSLLQWSSPIRGTNLWNLDIDDDGLLATNPDEAKAASTDVFSARQIRIVRLYRTWVGMGG